MRYVEPFATPNEAESMAATVPAAPHSAPVISQTASMMRPVGMPQLRASVGLVAVARTALPRRVNLSSAWIASMAATAMPMTTTCTRVKISPPAVTAASSATTYDTLSYPTRASSTLLSINAAARDTITMPMWEVPRRRNGAYSTRCSARDAAAPQAAATASPVQMLNPARFTP